MKKSVTKNLKPLKSFWIVVSLLLLMISCTQLPGGGEGNGNGNGNGNVVKVNRPFPQHVTYAGSNFTKPAYEQSKLDGDVSTFFKKWKDMYIRPFAFINGPKDGNATGYIIQADANGKIDEWQGTGIQSISQSEATGYAMIIFALMANEDADSKKIFDGMFTIYRNLPCKDNPALMGWAVPAPNLTTIDQSTDFVANPADFSAPRLSSATDGDMDVAYALLLADKQWGSDGRYNYLAEAKTIIAALEDNAIYKTGPNSYYPRLNVGDRTAYPTKKYEYYKATRSSDWILTHTTAFYDVTGNVLWKELQDVMIKMAADGRNPVTGLVSDFYGDSSADNRFTNFEGISDESGGKYDDDYYYNASRFPWRMAMGHAHHNLAEPQQFSQTITEWLVRTFTTGTTFVVSDITAGYALDGTKLTPGSPAWPTWTADAFNGPFMAGMAVSGSQYQGQLTQMWDDVIVFEGIEPWGTNYFDDTLSLMSLLFVSGNWWAPTVN